MGAKFKKVLFYSLAIMGIGLIAFVGYMKFFLPEVGAAPYLEIQATSERVERGKYLANNVAVCMDCHSTRDWSLFSGPLQHGTLGKRGGVLWT